jgi:hypothetical protein
VATAAPIVTVHHTMPHPDHPASTRRPAVFGSGSGFVAAMALGAASLLLGGCYNGDALVARVRSHAISNRIEEIPLGSYRVTLPRDNRTAQTPVVEVQLFGETARRDRAKVERLLKQRAFLVNDRAMTTLRLATREELYEPSLEKLRKRLLKAVNDSLEGAPLTAVGISDFKLIQI